MTETNPDADIELREITGATLRGVLELKVAPGQEKLVATNAVSIAQAYFEPRAWFRAIYAADTPVGFVMLIDVSEDRLCYLWRFMIDARFQGHGCGRRAMELLIERARQQPELDAITLSHADADGHAGGFYRRMGFVDTGELDEDEVVMRLELGDR